MGLVLAITIRLVDFGNVPEKNMAMAAGIAGYALGKAGVEVTWLRCPGRAECGSEPANGEFRLLILNLRPSRNKGDKTGFAVIPREAAQRYAGVFYPMVEDGARNLDADPAHLLGAVMAHEIGHLLLGSQAHSRAGIMCPHFRQENIRMATRGELLFTAEQAERIRAPQGQAGRTVPP